MTSHFLHVTTADVWTRPEVQSGSEGWMIRQGWLFVGGWSTYLERKKGKVASSRENSRSSFELRWLNKIPYGKYLGVCVCTGTETFYRVMIVGCVALIFSKKREARFTGCDDNRKIISSEHGTSKTAKNENHKISFDNTSRFNWVPLHVRWHRHGHTDAEKKSFLIDAQDLFVSLSLWCFDNILCSITCVTLTTQIIIPWIMMSRCWCVWQKFFHH